MTPVGPDVETRKFLGNVPLFADALDAGELDALAIGTRQTEFDRAAVIVRQHDLGESMFAILRGTAEVSTRHAGAASHVATLRAGDIFGEMSLLTGARRSATVTAVGPVIALEIGRSALQPILAASPALYDRFAAILDQRRFELDRVHGDGFWNLYGLPRDQIAPAIRSFFARSRSG
jgi:CRP/FNR family transcriptional regulator, cyclic AMP receptor protein